MTITALDSLHELAELHGVCTWYQDVTGQRRDASPEALLRVLQALGAPIQRVEEASDAVRQCEAQAWQRVLEPVTIAWEGRPAEIHVRLPTRLLTMPMKLTARNEHGNEVTRQDNLTAGTPHERPKRESLPYAACTVALPNLPLGRHRLILEVGSMRAEAWVVAAPEKAFAPPPGAPQKTWGVFAPLYSLHSRRSWGAGDFGDLEAFFDWVSGHGGGMVATLPLLAAFLDKPFEPGPYSPASRLFWNEFYLDLTRIPELAACPSAQRLLDSPEFQQEVAALRAAPLVEYQRQMALKRSVLEELASAFFRTSSPRREAFETYRAVHPSLDDYAAFRAVVERRGTAWTAWPECLRGGQLQEGDYDAANKQYHLYVQWLAREQLQALAEKTRRRGSGLYLDLPLGVNPDSYDVWREQELFVRGMAGGARPDPFFAKGQNWGFPPQNPLKMREQGYRYLTACLAITCNWRGCSVSTI